MNNINVKVYPVANGGTIKANISLCIDDAIVINDFKLIEGKNGMFISMPQRSYLDGKKTVYKDIAYFMDSDLKYEFEEAVFSKYDEEIGKNGKRKKR